MRQSRSYAVSGTVPRSRLTLPVLFWLAALPGLGAAQEIRFATFGTEGRGLSEVVRLDPIGLHDLRHPDQLALGNVRVRAGRSLGLVAHAGRASLPDLPFTVERELPLRWQIRVPVDTVPQSFRVRAEWESEHGEPGRSSLSGEPTQRIPVEVSVEGPWLVESDERTQLFEGTVTVLIPIDAIERAGDYRGRVVLDVDYF